MSVCYNCEERQLGCHDTCERFIKETEERIAKKRWLKKSNSNPSIITYKANRFYGDTKSKKAVGAYR